MNIIFCLYFSENKFPPVTVTPIVGAKYFQPKQTQPQSPDIRLLQISSYIATNQYTFKGTP